MCDAADSVSEVSLANLEEHFRVRFSTLLFQCRIMNHTPLGQCNRHDRPFPSCVRPS